MPELPCKCNIAYQCPKCETCFRCKHRSYFSGDTWFWICPRRVKGPWRAHPPYEPYDPQSYVMAVGPVVANDTPITIPAGVYGGILQ